MFKSNQKGFTLLELIVTIFVIIVGLIGTYNMAQYPLSRVSVSTNRLKAAYLAQEGVEIVRNIRDTNWIEEDNWKTGLDICDPSSKYCEAEYDDSDLTPHLNSEDPGELKINNTNNFYNYLSGSLSGFTRKIEIEDTTDDQGENILKVVVTVNWRGKEGGLFKLQENLYDYWGSQ